MRKEYWQKGIAFLKKHRAVVALAVALALFINASSGAAVSLARDAWMGETPSSTTATEETTAPTTATTTRTHTVTVTVDGKTQTVVARPHETVISALSRGGVEVGEADRLSVDRETAVWADMAVSIARVTYRDYTVSETIPYTTTIRVDPQLAFGTRVVDRVGAAGEKQLSYREVYVDGVLEETAFMGEEVVTPMVSQQLTKGTKPIVSQTIVAGGITLELDEKGQPIGYTPHYGSATAYTAPPGSGTATGRRAQVGVVAVDPKKIPYGSLLYIVSPDGSWVYGYAVAGDTGGACMSGRIVVDIFYDTVEECTQFGRRNMNVYVIG